MNTSNIMPKRGDVWDIDLDPTRGQEIQKTRPAVVISSDAVGKLRVKSNARNGPENNSRSRRH